MRVKDCRIFPSFNGTGLAVMTNTNRIFVVNNINDIRLRRLAEIPGLQSPTAWTMVNMDRQSRALVSVGRQLLLLDHGGQYQEHEPPMTQSRDFEAIIDMTVSLNNKCLALFTDTGYLWIGSSDLQVSHKVTLPPPLNLKNILMQIPVCFRGVFANSTRRHKSSPFNSLGISYLLFSSTVTSNLAVFVQVRDACSHRVLGVAVFNGRPSAGLHDAFLLRVRPLRAGNRRRSRDWSALARPHTASTRFELPLLLHAGNTYM